VAAHKTYGFAFGESVFTEIEQPAQPLVDAEVVEAQPNLVAMYNLVFNVKFVVPVFGQPGRCAGDYAPPVHAGT